EDDEVPAPCRSGQRVDLCAAERDALLEAELGGCPSRLSEVVLVDVDAGHRRAPLRQLEAVEPGVAADVEDRPAVEPLGEVRRERAPFERREIAEEVIATGLCAVRKVEVVKPGAEPLDLLFDGQLA